MSSDFLAVFENDCDIILQTSLGALSMYKRQLIRELIQGNETQTVEFKKSLSLQDKALESLCAFINTDLGYGEVIFGIDSNGNICGIEPGNIDSAQRSLVQTVRIKFEPALIVNIETELIDNLHVMRLFAERDQAIPYYEYDFSAWIREGTCNRKLGLSEKEQLRKRRDRNSHQGPWKCDRCNHLVGYLVSYKFGGKRMEKSFQCGCGGEFWPA